LRPRAETRAGICLVMGEFEPLKPSNTGWLVADVVPDTHAFTWSRTAVDPALPALLADPRWQPYVVFPDDDAGMGTITDAAHAGAGTAPGADPSGAASGKRPLFVLLDATWAEARKIFRKSPYLSALPRLSLQPQRPSRYRLRSSEHAHYLCTSEVAAMCLALAGDVWAAELLDAYLDVFTDHYRMSRKQKPVDGNDDAHVRLRALLGPRH
jgi:DTW domain-containing protein YfiP